MVESVRAVTGQAGWQRLVIGATAAIEVPARTGSGRRLGSGFLVAPGIVATCAHVLARGVDDLPEVVNGHFVGSGVRVRLHTRTDWYFRDADGTDLALLSVADECVDVRLGVFVLLSPRLDVGARIWAYGHPEGMFRAGQSAMFEYQGDSRRNSDSDIRLPRLYGTPVTAGYSGAAAVNLRTGAVCGMVCTSDTAGSAHLLPASKILQVCDPARFALDSIDQHRQWLGELTDDQLREGGWPFPGPRLRGYLATVQRAAELHPYPGVLPGSPQPPLSAVYVRQYAAADQGAEDAAQPRQEVPAAEVFTDVADSVLVGVAGAGKSSLLRRTMTDLAAAAERGSTRTVPVRVQAVELVQPRPFADLIADGVNGDLSAVGLRQPWPAAFFGTAPLPGARWLVLVDGLDEVMSTDQRRAIIDRLRGVRAAQGPDIYRFALVSRPDDSLNPRFHPDLAFFELLPFARDSLSTLARRWFEHAGLAEPDRQAQRFLDGVATARLDELASNPLMATMLCQLHIAAPDDILPNSRTSIYESFTRLLNDRRFRDSSGGIRQQVTATLARYGAAAEKAGERLVAMSDELIRRLAFVRMRGVPGAAVDLLAEWTKQTQPPHVPLAHWRSLLGEILRRSGTLVERADDFRFIHQTIEEFHAAQYVVADPTRSDAALRVVFTNFRRASTAAGREALTVRLSYTRFLIGFWQDRADLYPALRRLARTGVNAGRLIDALVSDGVPLEPGVVVAAVGGLRRLARRRRTTEADRRAAVELVARLDGAAGVDLLAWLAGRRWLDHSGRRWTIAALAARVGPGRSESYDRAALHVLASQPDPRWRDLLGVLADDRTLDGVDRRWAAEALADAGDPRGAALLANLVRDRTALRFDRELAARTLGEAGDPHGVADAFWRTAANEGPRLRELLAAWAPYAPYRLRRAELARQAQQIAEALDPLLITHRSVHPDADVRLLVRAYDFAQRLHADEYRRSGEPYVTHPVAVAQILAELGMDTATLVAALLHDTGYTADMIRDAFGTEIASLVQGLTALDDLDGADTEPDQLIARSSDLRALVLKLADRLQNLQTIRFLPPPRQEEKARETLEIFAPLAHRLGMTLVRWELEDRAFHTLFPKRSVEIERMLSEDAPQRDLLERQVTQRVAVDLRGAKIKAEVTSRPVRPYAVYRQMAEHGRAFVEATAAMSGYVLVDSVRDCYAALGVLQALWQPVPGRFKDYITMPKRNGYHALHTTLIGPTGRPVDLRIRTYAMHRTATYGITAHWRYDHNVKSVPTARPATVEGMLAPQLPDRPRNCSPCCAPIGPPTRSTSTHPRAMPSACRPARHRSTSHTPCTPTSDTSASEPRSTANSSRSSRRCPTATCARSSPPGPTRPAPTATGWASSGPRGRRRRSGRTLMAPTTRHSATPGCSASTWPAPASRHSRQPSATRPTAWCRPTRSPCSPIGWVTPMRWHYSPRSPPATSPRTGTPLN